MSAIVPRSENEAEKERLADLVAGSCGVGQDARAGGTAKAAGHPLPTCGHLTGRLPIAPFEPVADQQVSGASHEKRTIAQITLIT